MTLWIALTALAVGVGARLRAEIAIREARKVVPAPQDREPA